MERKTDDLLHDIKTSVNIKHYLNENSDAHININLPHYLLDLLIKKNLERKQVYNRGNITKSYGDNIFSGRKGKPSRDILLKFCFGFELNIDETQRLLRMARLGSLYARDKRDSVILFCLENRKTAVECDLLLDELNMPILSSQKTD